MSAIVTSPAGDKIEIVNDETWLKATDGTEKGLRLWNGGTKRFILADLWMHGSVEDPKTGRATRILWDRMKQTFGDDQITTAPTSFPGLAGDRMAGNCFARTTNGKRTYAIKLIALPRSWYDKMLTLVEEYEDDNSPIEPDEPQVTQSEPEIPEPSQGDKEAAELMEKIILPHAETDDEFERLMQDIQLDAPTEYDVAPPLDISIASQVAMSLLTTVVEIISAGSGAMVDEKVRKLQGDLADALGKLSTRLEENDRFRRQLRQAGDEITALRHERDGLRSRLRATEANLTAALKGDAVAAINGEIQRRVDSIMRVSPKAKGE